MNTIVFTRPIRRDSQAATGNENAASTPDQKKNTPAADSDNPNLLNSHSATQRLHREAAGESIDAEQRRHLVDDAAGRPERSGGLLLGRRAVSAEYGHT